MTPTQLKAWIQQSPDNLIRFIVDQEPEISCNVFCANYQTGYEVNGVEHEELIQSITSQAYAPGNIPWEFAAEFARSVIELRNN
jgi:hypothetical protein